MISVTYLVIKFIGFDSILIIENAIHDIGYKTGFLMQFHQKACHIIQVQKMLILHP